MTSDRERHVVIVGCGRVGTGLALGLQALDHTVAVVDADPRAFRRLGDAGVERIEGIGFDRATLVRAGVERAMAVAAVTDGDNTNIVVARTAREAFGVPRVFARVYDVRRASVYERLGIPTVASALLTIDMSMRLLLPENDVVRWTDPSARIALVEIPAPLDRIGEQLADYERLAHARVVAVRRLGSSVLATPDLVLQEGDVLYAVVDRAPGEPDAVTGGGER